MIEKDNLRKLAEEATPGPYVACGDDRGGCICGMVWSKATFNGPQVMTAKFLREDDDWPSPSKEQMMKNMLYFAAASPDVVLSLLAQITILENSNSFLESTVIQLNKELESARQASSCAFVY